ncbi:isoprenylcysteine carboxylmethyltransferase family protein [Paracoccus sp. YIM 132242]|uniref:Isoprenylcysteine carboxylmethyltransferase family protein n=1 Tax=Paracoccus lichenicola TaxID=2665644 RepID=A0A6L6HKE0_9RHOB|nr:methyltransferase [Paracoccus lichenicola]MTD99575.1 isoprenylcysteine carboxylmethyltransferase family protein [Paracoccus lichenicola]
MRVTADYPPVWLAGFVLAGWLAGRLAPHGPGWLAGWGLPLVLLGLVVMLWAGAMLVRGRTTVDPYGQPRHLVTTGPFRLSRNPIYLADALILAGLCLAFRAPLAAPPLVAGFVAVISARFIRAEEDRLARAFPEAFAAYRQRTHPWL